MRVFAGRDGATGKRTYLNQRVTGTKKDAEKVLTVMLRKLDTGELLHEPTRLTVKEYLMHWLETAAKPKLTARTLDDYTGVLERYVYPALGSRKLPKLAPVEIQTLYSKMLAPKDKDGMGLTPRTVINTHRVLSSALKQAVKWRMLSQNVCQYVDLPRQQKTEMQALSEEEATRFLKTAKSDRLYPLFALMLGTGLRPGEALALMWKDIDPMTGSLTVQRALESVRGKTSFKAPKTPRSRRNIKLSGNLVKLLLDHKVQQELERELVFPSADATPLNGRNVVNRHFKPLLKAANLPESVRLYDLRHTHATLLLKAGVHPKIVSERLGHSSIALTLDTYSHVLPGMQDEAASKLDAMLFRADKTSEARAFN
ncbi:MAG: tyrosine-type recombinase/integrase [Trueperaceae bacterium]